MLTLVIILKLIVDCQVKTTTSTSSVSGVSTQLLFFVDNLELRQQLMN